MVQVRVFETRVHADALVAKLTAAGFPAYVAVVENPTADLPGTYYRVRIGGFNTREEAAAFAAASLKPQGYDSWVDAKSNDRVGAASGSATTTEAAPAAEPPVSKRRHAHAGISASASLTPPSRRGSMKIDSTPRFSGHIGLDVSATPPPPPAASQAPSSRPAPQPVPQPVANTESAAAPRATPPAAHASVNMTPGVSAPEPSEPTPTAAPDTSTAAPASTQKDTMQSPFAREGYYRPVDSSTPPPAPASTVPDADTSTNSRRTLPTW